MTFRPRDRAGRDLDGGGLGLLWAFGRRRVAAHVGAASSRSTHLSEAALGEGFALDGSVLAIRLLLQLRSLTDDPRPENLSRPRR